MFPISDFFEIITVLINIGFLSKVFFFITITPIIFLTLFFIFSSFFSALHLQINFFPQMYKDCLFVWVLFISFLILEMFAIRSSSVPVFCQCPKNLKNDNCCQKLWKASKIKLTFWKSHRFHFLNHCLNQWLSNCRELFDQWKISFSFHLEPIKMKTWEAFHHFWSRLAVFFSGFAITVLLANFVTLSVFTFYIDESNTIQKIHQVFPLHRHLDSLNSGKKFFFVVVITGIIN